MIYVISVRANNTVFDAVQCNSREAANDELADHEESHSSTGVVLIFETTNPHGSINQFAAQCTAGLQESSIVKDWRQP